MLITYLTAFCYRYCHVFVRDTDVYCYYALELCLVLLLLNTVLFSMGFLYAVCFSHILFWLSCSISIFLSTTISTYLLRQNDYHAGWKKMCTVYFIQKITTLPSTFITIPEMLSRVCNMWWLTLSAIRCFSKIQSLRLHMKLRELNFLKFG